MKFLIVFLLGLGIYTTTHAQQCDKIIGNWLNKGGEGKILIYKNGNKYSGMLVWTKITGKNGSPLTDERNINPKLRHRLLVGAELLKGFTCEGRTYEGGTIYDPRHGKTGTGKLTLLGDKLHVEGYMGMFLVGEEYWTRAK